MGPCLFDPSTWDRLSFPEGKSLRVYEIVQRAAPEDSPVDANGSFGSVWEFSTHVSAGLNEATPLLVSLVTGAEPWIPAAQKVKAERVSGLPGGCREC